MLLHNKAYSLWDRKKVGSGLGGFPRSRLRWFEGKRWIRDLHLWCRKDSGLEKGWGWTVTELPQRHQQNWSPNGLLELSTHFWGKGLGYFAVCPQGGRKFRSTLDMGMPAFARGKRLGRNSAGNIPNSAAGTLKAQDSLHSAGEPVFHIALLLRKVLYCLKLELGLIWGNYGFLIN